MIIGSQSITQCEYVKLSFSEKALVGNRLGIVSPSRENAYTKSKEQVSGAYWVAQYDNEVRSNLLKAEELFKKAADQGLSEANVALEQLHSQQEQTKASEAAARDRFRKQAEDDEFIRKTVQAKAAQDAADRAEENAKSYAKEVADVQAAEQARIDVENKKDDAECKSFGAAVGSPSYVQCRISLKALRLGVLDKQQKAAQDDARADELKAQSEQQQRLAQQRAEQEAQQARTAQASREKASSDAYDRCVDNAQIAGLLAYGSAARNDAGAAASRAIINARIQGGC